MGGNYRFAPGPSATLLGLAGELIVRCDGKSSDGITLEARYVIRLGSGYDVASDGGDYYDLVFDKKEGVLTYVLTPYGIDTSLEFGANALVSNLFVHSLIMARHNHLGKLVREEFTPTEVRRSLDDAQGAELIAHLALLGRIRKEA